MSKLEHKSRLMYDMDSMKVWSVIDYDSDKMYLIKGSKGALLIDAGMASAGANNLYEYCKQLAGTDNIDVTFRMVIRIIPHNWAISFRQAARSTSTKRISRWR